MPIDEETVSTLSCSIMGWFSNVESCCGDIKALGSNMNSKSSWKCPRYSSCEYFSISSCPSCVHDFAKSYLSDSYHPKLEPRYWNCWLSLRPLQAASKSSLHILGSIGNLDMLLIKNLHCVCSYVLHQHTMDYRNHLVGDLVHIFHGSTLLLVIEHSNLLQQMNLKHSAMTTMHVPSC